MAEQLVDFYRHVSSAKRSLDAIVHDALTETREDLWKDARRDYDEEMQDILRAALRVAAETLAKDPAARGRRSGREGELREAIRTHMRACDERRATYQPSRTAAEAQARAAAMLAEMKVRYASQKLKPKRKFKRKDLVPANEEDAAYLAGLGLPLERLFALAGDLNQPPSTVRNHSLAGAVSQALKRKFSITEVRDRLLPALERCRPAE